jgi:signal transduction histidine kinase
VAGTRTARRCQSADCVSWNFAECHKIPDPIWVHYLASRYHQATGPYQRTHHEIRRLSHDLHPPILKAFGIDRALRQHCEEFGASHGMDIQLMTNIGSDPLSQELQLCFYRIAQESLRNVVKHANTNAVQISLVKNGAEYTLSISDQGRGFNPADLSGRGLGEAFYGTLTIWSKINHGTVITA